MDPRPPVSVCLAAYRGQAYIEEQIASILAQLAPGDEVVVVDDASPDATVEVVRAIADPRVRLVEAPANRGYVRTFEEALRLATGELLLLSDQDDVWLPGRLDAMVAALRDHDVVAGNLTTLGGPDRLAGPFGQPDWRLRSRDSGRHVANVLGILAGDRPYYGCAMGVRRAALEVLLPFPAWLVESHDLWIALYGNLAGSIRHLDERVLARRLHDANATPQRMRSVPAALRSRAMLLRAIAELTRRRRRAGR